MIVIRMAIAIALRAFACFLVLSAVHAGKDLAFAQGIFIAIVVGAFWQAANWYGRIE